MQNIRTLGHKNGHAFGSDFLQKFHELSVIEIRTYRIMAQVLVVDKTVLQEI